MRVTYTVEVSPAVSEVNVDEFAAEAARVFSDPRGWLKYGYKFARVPAGVKPDVRIRLETGTAAKSLCGMAGFSCQRDGPKDIIINLDNWLGKSASSLPIERYHNYVLNHEVGHHLGLKHQLCPINECRRRGMRSCPGSVMQQMTLGKKAIAPCIESDWPLDPDWRIDDPRPKKTAIAKIVRVALLIVLVFCIAAAIAGVCRRYSLGSQAEARPPLPPAAARPPA